MDALPALTNAFAPPNRTEHMREVMTVIYVADGRRVGPLDQPARRFDRNAWLPGRDPGGAGVGRQGAARRPRGLSDAHDERTASRSAARSAECNARRPARSSDGSGAPWPPP